MEHRLNVVIVFREMLRSCSTAISRNVVTQPESYYKVAVFTPTRYLWLTRWTMQQTRLMVRFQYDLLSFKIIKYNMLEDLDQRCTKPQILKTGFHNIEKNLSTEKEPKLLYIFFICKAIITSLIFRTSDGTKP